MTSSTEIIYIICHQVLHHPSEHGTSWMGEYLLANVHLTKLDKITELGLTELTSSTVDETALVILKLQERWVIPTVSLQRTIMFHIQVNPYWPNWRTKHSQQAAQDFQTSDFHQATWNSYLMLGFDFAQIPWNFKSNCTLQWSYQALWSVQV